VESLRRTSVTSVEPLDSGRGGGRERRRGRIYFAGSLARGGLCHGGGGDLAVEREREREREREGGEGEEGKKHDTHGPIGGSARRGMDERREGWKRGIERTDVYLAFAVPARHLVSCPPSLPPSLPPAFPPFVSPSLLSSLLSPPALCFVDGAQRTSTTSASLRQLQRGWAQRGSE